MSRFLRLPTFAILALAATMLAAGAGALAVRNFQIGNTICGIVALVSIATNAAIVVAQIVMAWRVSRFKP